MTNDSNEFSKRLAEILRSDKLKSTNGDIEDTEVVTKTSNHISLMSLYDSMNDFADEYDKQLNEAQPSIDDQITSIKSQLKHCKNPLQKLNLEREMNRLIKERRKCK